MDQCECDILFLADHLGGREEIQALVELVTRLEQFGHGSRVLCQSAVSGFGQVEISESPGLGRRWQRPWAIRGLDLGEGSGRPRLMHVLSAVMDEAGLEIAERWRLPYLLCVEEFPRKQARLRLSRLWCRGIVATNHELARALVRDFGIPSRVIHVVARGVVESPIPAKPSREERVPVVGAAGPLVRGSGFATFLNAARKVVDAGIDAEFLIAGQGEDEGDLRRRAERLRIAERLTFADDLPIGLTFWDVLDLYCETSISPTVGRPLSLAMASGVPSIATDVEGLRSLIKDNETGLIVPAGDSVALARSIVRLLEDREKARQLGESGKRAVLLDHRPDLEAERLHHLYRTVAKAGLGPQDSGLVSRSIAFDAESGLDAGRVIGGIAAPWFGPEG